MSDHIWMSKAVVGELEEQYVLAALRSGWVTSAGPDLDAFEHEVAERTGTRHAVGLASGTAALHLLLLAAGARPGTTVVTSTLTFAATTNAIVHAGAEPYFVDAVAEDANVDADLMLATVDRLRAEGRDVVAALPVDLYGRCCDYAVLEAGLEERGVALVEDAAEGLGASIDGRPAGSFGMGAAVSFNGNKIMTTSGGGMLVTNDEDVARRARYLSTQARQPVPWYEHTEAGYNYRLSNILAALGRAQLTRLTEMIAHRRSIREHYVARFAGTPFEVMCGSVDGRHVDNYWLTTVLASPDLGTGVPDRVVAELGVQGIEVRHMWKPMHLQPAYAQCGAARTGVADDLFARGINLPSGVGVTPDDVDRVADALLAAVAVTR